MGFFARSGISLLVAVSGVWVCLPAQAAPSPIKTEKKLKAELAKAEKRLVKSHLKLAKQMKKERKAWAAYLELLTIRRLDPKSKKVKKLLAKGPPAKDELDKGYTSARSDLDFEATQRLSNLIERAVAGGLSEASLASVALRLLQYEPNHLVGRQALGFTGEKQNWAGGHERRLRALYRAGFAKVPPAKQLKENPFVKLEEALGFEITVFEGAHCYAVCPTSTPMPERLQEICKSADLAYEAIHHDLFGAKGLLTPEGSAGATGPELKPIPKVIYLQLSTQAEHLKYLEGVVSDPNLKVAGKTLGMVVTPWAPQKTIVCDCWGTGYEREWPAERMARFVMRVRFGARRPDYLLQGISRYYSGHISLRARMRTVPVGSQAKGEKSYKAGSYALLRADAREDYNAFRTELPVSGGLFKSNQSMNRGDNAMASAFVDYLIHNDTPKLLDLFSKGDSKERQTPALIKEVFGDDPAAADELFSLWFERSY
jgi:hypothetical protein